jgi:hypothetical protein
MGRLLVVTETARVVWDRQDVTLDLLKDPALWGGPIEDERYLIHSRR